ncbi:polysaccharide pyruvyl transferase family protein [Microbacterium sp. LWH7-1.2]|uniref:polysaccharide pyruvyl transferase family protein n=1 Tax=Microbacterium sp. LWH7-1.2 TaxID=3135257 RepID=UPI00313A348F
MRRIFVNPAGQRDNLGDSILRRPYLDALRDRGELHVLAGKDRDYSSGLGIRDGDVVYESRAKWFAGALASGLVGKLIFASNAGEVVGTDAEKRRARWQPLIASLARRTGGDVIVAGVSVRPGTDASATQLPRLVRSATVVTWRDEAARQALRIGSVQPDWAFALGGTESFADRSRLAIALRGDRPPLSDRMVSVLRTYAEQHGLSLWVVVQVRRDAAAARELRSRLGAEIFDWSADTDHAHHERALREFYRTCRVIASDRIHALIIAATEGATPIGLATSDPAKLARTFDHVYPLPIIDARSETATLSDLPVDDPTLSSHLAAARQALECVRASIADPEGRQPQDTGIQPVRASQ